MTRLEELIQTKNTNHIRKQRATSILLVLSLLVSCAVFYNLRLTGITLAGDAHCGIEEHSHSEDCYEYALVCPLSETAETAIAQPEYSFITQKTDSGMQQEPTDSQSEPDTVPPIEVPESDAPTGFVPAVPHRHSAENGCYQKEYICTKQEHRHDMACYSNDEADVETPAVWEAEFASVSASDRIDRLVAIAKTQIGYRESESNFRTENGEKQGYTRYGTWYGNPYGKWSTMFAAFCLHYAGFPSDETPYAQNTESMYIAWKNKGLFRSKDDYVGQVGDIVFLADGLCGIIVKQLPDYIHVIIGDMDDSVQKKEIQIRSSDVLGYGAIPRPVQKNPYGLTPLTITASAKVKRSPTRRMATYATRAGAQNIKDYIISIGGSFEFTLLDADKQPILPDENGDIFLEPKTEYLVSLTMRTGEENGILPGEYIYTLPEGVITAAESGDIITTDGMNIGRWEINEAGEIRLTFNESTNSLGDVLVNVTTGAMFPADTELDLDGSIHVTVRPEIVVEDFLNVTKWGRGVRTDEQGNLVDANGNSYNHHILPWGEPVFTETDFSRIYWDVYITGSKDDALAGYVITDQLTSPTTHYYSPKDMEAGVVVKYSGAQLNPDELHWITLKPGTPGLEWTEHGFSYTMPHVLTCEDPNCSYKNPWVNTENEPITITGDWVANIDYFSTLRPAVQNGWLTYTNKIYVGDKVSNGLVGQQVSIANARILKDGAFNGQQGDFQWLISVDIPGQSGENLTVPWALMDITKLSLNGTTAFDFEGAFWQPVKRMTATIGNTTFEVPYITDITADYRPQMAYSFGYVSNGPVTSMVMYLLRPCNCTGTANCDTWDEMGRCASGDFWVGSQLVSQAYDYCRCWNIEDNVHLQIEYTSPGAPVIEASKNQIGEYINIINLNQIQFDYSEGWAKDNLVMHDTATAKVPVPSVFDKVLTADPTKENSYIASYTITVNESKVDLSAESSIQIEDTMSNTLVYIPGSLVVRTEDAQGNVEQLVYGKDYTLAVGGTGNLLSIEIFNPKAFKYTFNYDCRITVPPGQTSLLFDNAAKIKLFGVEFEDEQPPKQVTNVAASATSYRLNVLKLDADTNNQKPLSGARIGFFAQNGEKITERTSDTFGRLSFETDLSKGIVIQEHFLYYVQELEAPTDYMLDDQKIYFFCCDKDAPCEECAAMADIANGENAIRVENGTAGTVTIYNRKGIPLLPETGANGPLIYYIMGTILTLGPCVYIICSKRHKKERRFG